MHIIATFPLQYYIQLLRGDIIKSLFKSVAILTIFSVITKFLGFVFRLYLSRKLPTDILGMYTIAASVALVFETIVAAGMPLVISRTTASNIVNGKEQDSHSAVTAGLIWCTLLAILITFGVLLGKNVFLHMFTDSNTYVILLTMLPSVLFTALYTPFKGYLWGQERYFAVSMVELIEQVVRVIICVILFTNTHIDIMLPAGIGLSVACGISGLVGIVIYFGIGGKLSSPQGHFGSVVHSVAPLTATRVASSMLTPLINILLPIVMLLAGYTNTQAMSLIGIVVGMTIPLLFVPSAVTMSLGMALTPKLSKLKKEGNHYAICNQIDSSITFTIYSCILFIPLFGGLGEQLCTLLYNNALAGAYLSKFAWVILPMGLSQITSSILNSLGHEKSSFVYFMISSAVVVALICVLPYIVGIYAMLVAIAVGNTLTFVLNILKINKATGHIGTFVRKTVAIILISIPVSVLTHLSYNLLTYIFPHMVCMLICAMLSVACTVALLMCLNLVDYEFIATVVGKIKPKRIK